jgi:enoyl-CoA hydratase
LGQILCEIAERVAVVTLNDPERRNALNMTMVEEIVETFDKLESDPDVGAVVVTGAPPAFCAGADLSHLGGSQREGLRSIYEGFLRVGRSPLPTIAAVNGAAVGAGMNLALCCDLRLAARRAKFDTRFLQLGLHPGGGHTWMFRRITGPQAVFATVLFGEVLDGAEAERCGLVWRCVDDDARAAPQPGHRSSPAASRPPSTTWPPSATTTRPSTASSSRRSGRSANPTSASGWPRCSRRSPRSRRPS